MPRLVALGLSALAAASPRAAAAPQTDFSNVQAALSEQDYPAALELADQIDDELLSMQSVFHVLHHGGDLSGALAAGRECLERFPDDLYMLDQVAYVAGTLGATDELEEHMQHVRELVADGRVSQAAAAPILERHAERLTALLAKRAARERSDSRARSTALLLGVATLCAMGWIARREASDDAGGAAGADRGEGTATSG